MTLSGSARLYYSTTDVSVIPTSGVGTSKGGAQGTNSSNSWDLDELMKTNQEIAKLMRRHKNLHNPMYCHIMALLLFSMIRRVLIIFF